MQLIQLFDLVADLNIYLVIDIFLSKYVQSITIIQIQIETQLQPCGALALKFRQLV